MRAARIANVVLETWLFLSAFLWPHSGAHFTNSWLCGLLVVTFALCALRWSDVRYANTVMAIWLFISAFALPSEQPGTVWNNVLLSIAVFIISLVPQPDELGGI